MMTMHVEACVVTHLNYNALAAPGSNFTFSATSALPFGEESVD